MKKRGWIVAALGIGAYALLWRHPMKLEMTIEADADPDILLDLVSQVEREPEFIPAVESVRLESRDEDTMTYRVDARIAGAPLWARFKKHVFREEGRAEWTTLAGVMGFKQNGSIQFRKHHGATTISLKIETRFAAPVAGPFLAPVSLPILACQMNRWIQNLIREEKRVSETRRNDESAVELSKTSSSSYIINGEEGTNPDDSKSK